MPRRERVTEVIDGDSFRTASRPKNSVRLARVYAPELKKPGGAAAKRHLENLIGGKMVTVGKPKDHSFERPVAEVKVEGRSVNNAMNKKLKKK